ncbi:ribonuclease H-like domain-containing protein, partial [Tanacetum coccineum]
SRPIRLGLGVSELSEFCKLLAHFWITKTLNVWEYTIDTSRVYSKLNINNWRIIHKRVPTRSNLDIRGVDLDYVHCPIYDDKLESADYISVMCNVAHEAWKNILFGINKWYQSFALRNFDLEDMELESTNSGPTAKLPILKLVPQTSQENGITVTKMSTPATAKEKTNKKNDVKARGLLLMALPNEHQLTFSQYPDAKSMFAAIETRFGGNAATKKTLLKQQYENFSATSAESLDSIFNRLQKIISRLAILGVIIDQEDLNLKFLSSLPPEWNTHVVVWMNKPEVETMSIDDLYNNFKIVEQKVKKTVGTSSGGQNLAFMTAPSSSSTNDANTAYPQVSAASPSVNAASPQDLEQIHEDDLEAMDLKWQLSLLSVGAKKYYHRTGKKIFINANDIAGYDKSKVECLNLANVGYRWVGFDWSDMVDEQVQTTGSMAFSDSEFKEPEFKGYDLENSEQESNVVCDKKSDNSKENSVESLVEEQVSQDTSSFVESSPNGKPQHDDKGFVNSGCSRHMTGNITYLSDFKEFDGGYVVFWGGISKEVGTPRYLSLVVPLTKVGDEAIHKELGDRMERAATTTSS